MELFYIKLAPLPCEGVTKHDVISKLFAMVHAHNQNNGRTLAFSLGTEGNEGVAVFSQTQQELKNFLSWAAKKPVLRDYCKVPEGVKSIEITEKTKLTAWVKFKMNTRKSFTKMRSNTLVEHTENKNKIKKKLPFCWVRTQTGNCFVYQFEKIENAPMGFNPNGYGVANPSSIFGLPIV